MRVAVTGATGMIGRALVFGLREQGHEVVALGRDIERARVALGGGIELHEWRDPQRGRPPAAALSGADGVVHLLGEPVAQRWSDAARREIHDSRVLSTEQLVAALGELAPAERPGVLVSQSTTGYYGDRGDEKLTEDALPGDDFLARVTIDWERAAEAAAGHGLRVVRARSGVVLAREAGALAKMLPPFRLGVGGPVAGGHQYVPWIALADEVAALVHCLRDGRLSGPVNLCAPEPVTNTQLSKALGRALHRPAVLPVPGLALRLLYGQMAQVVLDSQRAIPQRLSETGFSWSQREIEPALRAALE